MIVGADAANDGDIITRASTLYDRFRLRRVYYSAFSPIPDASAVLPLKRPPLMREHRLYQSDWLMRFYGFKPSEVVSAAGDDGMLPLDMDPKLAWALKFRDSFPVDVNRAAKEQLLRVPGLGTKAVKRILSSRRWRQLRLDDVARLTLSITKVRPFIVTADWRPTLLTDRADLRTLVAPKQSSWSCSLPEGLLRDEAAFGEPAAADRNGEQPVDQRVRPAVVGREVAGQRVVMELMGLRSHQQSQQRASRG